MTRTEAFLNGWFARQSMAEEKYPIPHNPYNARNEPFSYAQWQIGFSMPSHHVADDIEGIDPWSEYAS